MLQLVLATSVLFPSANAMAVDSYRYLHVTIDTPWMIFVFLFFLVVAPMILSAILHLRNAVRRDKEEADGGNRHEIEKGNKESESGTDSD